MVYTKHLKIYANIHLSQAVNYIEDEVKSIPSQSLVHLTNTFDYISNPKKILPSHFQVEIDFPVKVQNGKKVAQLVSTYGVTKPSTAADEFIMTKRIAEQRLRNKKSYNPEKDNSILAHHLIQSFSPEDDLSPQEIHEIGRKTVLELTGGEHEFVIATHVDKNHIHNHIIFNSTNSVTLKKFRWQKGTKRVFERISDKHAGIAGAKIIDKNMKNSRKDYVAYRKKHVYSYEIKERLNFLLKHATSMEDFLEKAAALRLQVDTSGKEVKYKLLEPLGDKLQERFIRDRTLSKKGNYSVEKLTQRFEKNEATLSKDQIYQAYLDHKAEQEQDFEMRLTVEPWQVTSETATGIYLELEYGLGNQGLVLIPSRYVEKNDNGSYDLFIRRNDWFYFTNSRDASLNRAMNGDTIAKQLSYDNGQVIINKHPAISKLNHLVREFNFLSSHGVSDGQQFDELATRLRAEVEATQGELDRLDERLSRLNKAQAALLELQEGYQGNHDLAEDLLKATGLPLTTNKDELDKIIKEALIERAGLKERFDSIVADGRTYKHIRENVRSREAGSLSK